MSKDADRSSVHLNFNRLGTKRSNYILCTGTCGEDEGLAAGRPPLTVWQVTVQCRKGVPGLGPDIEG